jgi:hypothetical protein
VAFPGRFNSSLAHRKVPLARGNTLRNGTEGPLLERMLSGGVSLWQGQTGSFDLCLSGSWGRAAVGHKPSFDKGFLAGGCAAGSPQSPPRTVRNGLPGDDARHFLASLGLVFARDLPYVCVVRDRVARRRASRRSDGRACVVRSGEARSGSLKYGLIVPHAAGWAARQRPCATRVLRSATRPPVTDSADSGVCRPGHGASRPSGTTPMPSGRR